MTRRDLVALGTLAPLYMVALLWTGSLVPSDDVVFAIMVREMLAGSRFLDLTLQGIVSHQRPPLAVWMMAGSAALLGQTELALRLPAALASAVTLVLVGVLGARLFSRTAGLAAAAALAGSTLFYYTGRRVLTDPVMVALCVACTVAYVRARARRPYWVLAGAMLGLALMVKQMVPLLCCAPLGVHFVASGRWREERWRGPLLAVGAAALVLSPWHLAQTVRHGSVFWSEYLGRHVLERATSSFFVKPDRWFYLRELWTQDGLLLPGYGLGLGLGVVAWARHRERRPQWALVLVWAVLAWLPFQLSATRVAHYLLPLLVPLALALGAAVAAGAARVSIRRHWLVLLLCVVALARNAPHLASPDYGPDEKRFGVLVHEQHPQGALVTAVDSYAQSLFWYASYPLDFTVTQPRAAGVMHQTLVLASADAIHSQTLGALAGRLAGRVGYLVHRSVSTPRLLRELEMVPGVEMELTEGTYLNLLRLQVQPTEVRDTPAAGGAANGEPEDPPGAPLGPTPGSPSRVRLGRHS